MATNENIIYVLKQDCIRHIAKALKDSKFAGNIYKHLTIFLLKKIPKT